MWPITPQDNVYLDVLICNQIQALLKTGRISIKTFVWQDAHTDTLVIMPVKNVS
jgi:hypothetical protein